MSWESTVCYYTKINEGIKHNLGGLHSAKIVMYSVDFDEIEKLLKAEDWNAITKELSEAASKIQVAGADVLIICTNTMHNVADDIEKNIGIPLLHIADSTAEALLKKNIKKVGLLGTSFTMEQDFYKARLINNYNLEVVIPNDCDRKIINDVIFEELCLGKTENKSKIEFLRIIECLVEMGAEAIVLGCTEIGNLINQGDTNIPLYDTTDIHASSAVEFAI